MHIIISPAKKINDKNDFNYKNTEIIFKDKANQLYDYLKSLSFEELKKLYKTSDKITTQMFDTIKCNDINKAYLTALFAYDGIQYKNLNATLLTNEELDYLDKHLYILSGLYGLLRPFDQIIPYRLEMGTKELKLYEYWNDVNDYIDDDYIINLASNEYSKLINRKKHKVIDIFFYEEINDKLIEKSVYVKMARGSFLRYMAINKIEKASDLANFNELGYNYSKELSNDSKYIFVRRQEKC